MNPGTFYLYEYENARRTRNVGFIKIARHYRSCILQIHARGIPAGNGASMELYAFYRDGEDMIAEQIAAVNCFGRNISMRLPVSETGFPDGRPLMQIDGFLIKLPGERPPLFWMASAFFFDADIRRLKIASAKQHSEEQEAYVPKAETRAAEADLPENKPPEPQPEPKPKLQDTDSPDPAGLPEEEAEEAPEAAETADAPPADNSTVTGSDMDEPDEPLRVKKIQRSDISQLPRKFWPLANNSFLLHGYHNYSHLLLIEEDGRLWLGVPGVYAPQEARAADLFGFPRFTRSYVVAAELSAQELSESEEFGHWCRCVGSCPASHSIPFIS